MHEQENFPIDFFRGLTAETCVTPEGYVTTEAFSFDTYDCCARNNDNFCELSINWNDNEESLRLLLAQLKPHTTEKQFKQGYCKISKIKLHGLFEAYINDGKFTYERKPLEIDIDADIQANPYHGNLLMNKDLDRRIKRNIQHSLATDMLPL